MLHLRQITLTDIPTDKKNLFPFSTQVISALSRIILGQPVTFFVGENGSGKSTLLEGIAAKCDLPITRQGKIESHV